MLYFLLGFLSLFAIVITIILFKSKKLIKIKKQKLEKLKKRRDKK